MVQLKERLFVTYYLGKAKGNGTLAARLAGYNDPSVVAHRLLKKSHILAAIESKLDKIAMSEEEVLARLSERAAAGAGDFVTLRDKKNPNALPSLDLAKAHRRGQLGAIKKIKTTRTPGDNPQEITEVEVHDSFPALALLAKFHGLLVERHQIEPSAGAGKTVRWLERKLAESTGTGPDPVDP